MTVIDLKSIKTKKCPKKETFKKQEKSNARKKSR